jgi:SAM-dependent methyltransferase
MKYWPLNKWNTRHPSQWGFESKIHIDMGCGFHPRNPFGAERLIGIDILPSESFLHRTDIEYIQVALGQQIPMPNGSVDTISGYDFVEHLNRGNGSSGNEFISFMSEAHRVLRPGGILFLVTPAFPSPAAFQDPTHVNFITEQTVNYFLGPDALAQKMGYGFSGSFEMIAQTWMGPFASFFDSSNISGSVFLSPGLFSMANVRRMVSCLRHPTHLVWLLRKFE